MVLAVDWPQAATWAGVAVAVVVAGFEIRAVGMATKVQRAIDVHRDLTAGDVGAARLRLGAEMWRKGEAMSRRHLCYAPAYKEIYAPESGFGRYESADETELGDPRPGSDLYLLVWCFQRVEAGLRGHAFDEQMIQRLVAPHAIWWNELTRNISEDEVLHLRSLRYLASRLSTPELERWAKRDFIDRSALDTPHSASPDDTTEQHAP